MTSISHAHLEQRVKHLEEQLGILAVLDGEEDLVEQQKDDKNMATVTTTTSTTSPEFDLTTRISRLEQQWQELLLNNKLQSSHQDWIDSLQLLHNEIDPGTSLTYQTQMVAAPFLYRRQEIIVQHELIKSSLQQLSNITSLLLIGQAQRQSGTSIKNSSSSILSTPTKSKRTSSATMPSSSSSSTAITETQVVNAPILIETRLTDAVEMQEKLQRLAQLSLQLQQRSTTTTKKLDRMLKQYHGLLNAISERTVLLDTELTRRGV